MDWETRLETKAPTLKPNITEDLCHGVLMEREGAKQDIPARHSVPPHRTRVNGCGVSTPARTGPPAGPGWKCRALARPRGKPAAFQAFSARSPSETRPVASYSVFRTFPILSLQRSGVAPLN
ncbi:hypothetical protein H8959_021600 [Pygathrix nigripes]